MSSSVADMYEKPVSRNFGKHIDIKNEEMEIKALLRDVERLGSSGRTWKERKAIENQNVVAMGGKPQKKHRTPLSVALPAMKNKKKREHKQLEEDLILGRFTKRSSGGKKEWKRKPEDKVLRSSEGYFKKGVLDVKHLLRSDKPTKDNDVPHEKLSKGKNKRKGNKKVGKRRGR